MREIAEWLSKAVSVVEGCGDPEAEILLQQGVMSLEDLADCQIELLSSLPGIDDSGAALIRERARELAIEKLEHDAKLRAESVENEEAPIAGVESDVISEAGELPADTE